MAKIQNESVFTDDDMTVETYRAFSPAALAAFLFSAVTSLIGLVNSNLLALPVVALLFAIFSLFKLLSIKGPSMGWTLTALAIMMPLFAITAPLCYRQIRLYHITDTAIEHANAWLELSKQGKVHEAYQMTQLRYARAEPGSDLAVELGTTSNPGKELEAYVENEPEISLRKDGDQAKLEVINVNYFQDKSFRNVEHVVVNYRYTRPDGEKRLFSIDMRRHVYAGKNEVYWSVWEVRNRKPSFERKRFDATNFRPM